MLSTLNQCQCILCFSDYISLCVNVKNIYNTLCNQQNSDFYKSLAS